MTDPSVGGKNIPDLVVVNDVDGAGGAWGAVAKTTAGQTRRYALDVLIALGVLSSGTIAEQSLSQAANNAFAKGANADKAPQWAVRELLREMAAEDENNDIYHSAVAVLEIQDKAVLSEYLGDSSEIA